MTVRKSLLIWMSFAYIYIPILLFFIFWTRLPVAIVCIAPLAYLVYRAVREKDSELHLWRREAEPVRISPVLFACVLVFLFWACYHAGLGRWVWQEYDWYKHNAILADLTQRPWPVYYTNGDCHSMLTYYIGQYLVPGFCGKVLHSVRAAEIANYLWVVAGLVLIFMNLVEIIHSDRFFTQALTAFCLVFFSIPMWLSEMVMKRLLGINHVGSDLWFYAAENLSLQYTSNFALLRWVFPQTIAIWLIALLFFEMRGELRYYVFIFLPGILYGTIAFMGFVPIALAGVLERFVKTKRKADVLKEVFSFENISLGATHGLIYALYLYGNVFGEKPGSVGMGLQDYKGRFGVYLCFVIVNVLVYVICVVREFRKDYVFWGMTAGLMIIPFFRMGLMNDFVMRTPIPLLFLLMVYVLIYIDRHLYEEAAPAVRSLAVCVLFALIFIGSYYEEQDLVESIRDDVYGELGNGLDWASLEIFANPENSAIPGRDDLVYNYFAYDIEDNLFNRYVAQDKYPEVPAP